MIKAAHSNKRGASFWRRMVRDRAYSAMALPGFLYYIIFQYIPMFGIIIAFQKYNIFAGFLKSPFVGFKHFIDFFQNGDAALVLKNTVILNVLNIVCCMPMPILLALMLNEVRQRRYKRVVQTATYFPHFLSAPILIGLLMQILSSRGPINNLLAFVGLERVVFMSEVGYFRPIYVLLNIYKTAGWGSIIYLSALTSIDPQQYEAAIVDGANKFRQIWHVSLPGILPTIVIVMILNIGSLFSSGIETILLLRNPMNTKVSEVFGTLVYFRGVAANSWGIPNYSYAAAVGLFQNVVNLFLLLSANYVSKKVTEYSWF